MVQERQLSVFKYNTLPSSDSDVIAEKYHDLSN